VSVAQHIFWITSRAAGTLAMLLASAAVFAGLLVSARRKTASNRADLRAIHEALSLSTLAMVAVHGTALLGDAFMHPGIAGIAVPFVGTYRPLWTGAGIVAGYGLGFLGLSYYARDRLGAARWRRLHRLTAIFWLMAIAHSIGAGSDAAEPWFLALNLALVVPAALLLALRWVGRAAESQEANSSNRDEALPKTRWT
jgi:sulfoxide reductase heme-binding subunit YedZ